jgi:hypothetical protein
MPSVFSELPMPVLGYQQCSGNVPGRYYNAPGPVIAVAYNGVLMRRNQPRPVNSYTEAGGAITLNFLTGPGDRIDAFTIA